MKKYIIFLGLFLLFFNITNIYAEENLTDYIKIKNGEVYGERMVSRMFW